MPDTTPDEALRFHPTFDPEHHALIPGHCQLCGCELRARVIETKATGLWHCGKPWASFDGHEIAYSDTPSLPKQARRRAGDESV